MAKDIIDSVEIIKLEDTKEPIGHVKKIIVEDKKIIVFDDTKKNVLIFSDKGKYLNSINKFGEGRTGYSSISNISYTAPDKIHIVDNISKSIKTYKVSGEYVGENIPDGRLTDYINYQDITYSFYYERNKKNNMHHFSFKQGEKKSIGFFDYTKPFLFIGNGGDFIIRRNNSVYLTIPYNDTIYILNKDILTAKYHFDFGENSYPSAAILKTRNVAQLREVVSKKKYEGNISNVIISDNYITLNYHKEGPDNTLETSVLVYNMKTKKSSLYHSLVGDEPELALPYPMAADNSFFYSLYTSNELPRPIIEQYKERNIHSSRTSNPTIVKYKYKL